MGGLHGRLGNSGLDFVVIGIDPTVDFACKRRVIEDPTEQWLYFFRRAGKSTAKELIARLPDPVFAEAIGVLEMIAQNPEERRLYNERLLAMLRALQHRLRQRR